MIRAVVLPGETWLTPRGGQRMSIESVERELWEARSLLDQYRLRHRDDVIEIGRLQGCERALELAEKFINRIEALEFDGIEECEVYAGSTLTAIAAAKGVTA